MRQKLEIRKSKIGVSDHSPKGVKSLARGEAPGKRTNHDSSPNGVEYD